MRSPVPPTQTLLTMSTAHLTLRDARQRIFSLARLFLGLMAGLPFALLHAAATGTISGTVSNSATGNLLPGAKVEISTLGCRRSPIRREVTFWLKFPPAVMK